MNKLETDFLISEKQEKKKKKNVTKWVVNILLYHIFKNNQTKVLFLSLLSLVQLGGLATEQYASIMFPLFRSEIVLWGTNENGTRLGINKIILLYIDR